MLIRNIFISLSIDNGEASPHILLKLVISKPVRRDARRLFYFCGIFPLYYYGMNVCIPSNISLRFYIRKMTQINAARNIKQRLFLFFRKNPVPLPESKTKGCPCRAEIIPYEPDTVSTGEGIVSSENTLYIPPSPERCLFGLLLIIFILYLL